MKLAGGEHTVANYNRLRKVLLDKKLKRTDLRELAGISTTSVTKFGKGEYVSIECMDRISIALKRDIGEIISFSRDEH